MNATLKTINLTDWKGEPITYYEMDLKFQHTYHNFTYFSIEGESKQGFVDRITYEVKKMYSGATLNWTEE
jgi:hypothetical protein